MKHDWLSHIECTISLQNIKSKAEKHKNDNSKDNDNSNETTTSDNDDISSDNIHDDSGGINGGEPIVGSTECLCGCAMWYV